MVKKKKKEDEKEAKAKLGHAGCIAMLWELFILRCYGLDHPVSAREGKQSAMAELPWRSAS